MKQNVLKILSTPVDRGGCGWYRVRQPFRELEKYTSANAHVIDKDSDDMLQIAAALTQADILVVRQGGEGGIEALRGAADTYAHETGMSQGFHAKIIIDIDDNIELISPYSEHYGEYGTYDFFDRNANKFIWQHGRTPNFDVIRNRWKVMSFMYGLRKADMVTVTTENLAAYARLYNKNVAVLPNAINTDVWWKPEFKENEQLRVGWSGGHSHYEDWYTIKEPLNILLRKYQFKLIMGGTGFIDLIDKDLHHLVEVKEWVPFEAHSYHTMLFNLDIAIIPLADIPFNSYKSAIKWFEFSSMGVPSVVSNVTPYKEVISSKTALGYDSPQQFYKQLELLLNNKEQRQTIGSAAFQEVHTKWTTKIHAKTYLDTYQSLLDK